MPTLTIAEALKLAQQHRRAGGLAEAERVCRQILAFQPDHAEGLHLLGLIAYQAGKNDLAVALIGRAIAFAPGVAHFHSNLGLALEGEGLLDQAAAAHRAALALRPNFFEAHFNLGNVLRGQGRLQAAAAAFRAALEFKSDFKQAHVNLANVLTDQGLIEEAIDCQRRALLIWPQDALIHSNLVYILELCVGCDSKTIREEQARWSERHEVPLRSRIRPHLTYSHFNRRLKIGYVSADFREHVAGRNLLPLFSQHDRKQSEIFCYSGVTRTDAITERFRALADHWRNTVNVADEELHDVIRKDAVDILVDLALHTAGNRLPMFALKPAPVQVSFAGYPGSTGLRAIEYRISDPHLEVGTSLAEDKVCLIESFWCYDPLDDDAAPNALPAFESGQVTFGCLNKFAKVNDPTLALWARVLGAASGSRLLILAAIGEHRERTLEMLRSHGVASQRVEFVEPRPRRDYLELHHRVDIVLDTFPYNGHTTSLEAFWMGVPVVSLVGERPVSRAGLSISTNLGLPEFAARSEDEFTAITWKWASDLPRLSALRGSLRARMEASVLMDAPRFACSVEAAYRAMWQRVPS